MFPVYPFTPPWGGYGPYVQGNWYGGLPIRGVGSSFNRCQSDAFWAPWWQGFSLLPGQPRSGIAQYPAAYSGYFKGF